jgi:hypothetical protein
MSTCAAYKLHGHQLTVQARETKPGKCREDVKQRKTWNSSSQHGHCAWHAMGHANQPQSKLCLNPHQPKQHKHRHHYAAAGVSPFLYGCTTQAQPPNHSRWAAHAIRLLLRTRATKHCYAPHHK